MKAEFLPRGRVKAEAGAHLFEGVDISGIYDDEDAAFWRETIPQRAAAAAPVIIEQRQARRDRRAIQARRSQFLERAWIYSALIAAFAVVIGISVG
jgi:anti-sigma factor RsiW